MFKNLIILVASLVAVLNLVPHNNSTTNVDDSVILNNQSLALAGNDGDFLPWTERADDTTGIFNSSKQQSYWLENSGVSQNIDLQITNFTKFNGTTGIANLSYYQGTADYFNKGFLISKTGIVKKEAIATYNNQFVNLNATQIVSYGIGATLITLNSTSTDVTVTTLVNAYEYGYSPTSFTRVNATTGIFIGGDQNFYLLKITGVTHVISPILYDSKPLVASNPNLMAAIANLNDNKAIIRNNMGAVFKLDTTTGVPTPIILDNKNFISTTKEFFTKLNDSQGILNANISNTSIFFGQPYLFDDNSADITLVPNHFFASTIYFHNNLAIFIDNLNSAFFLKLTANNTLTFTLIGAAVSFQRINDHLGFLKTLVGNRLLKDSVDSDWSLINTIKFTSNSSLTAASFVNSVITEGKEVTDRTNTWVANDSLNLQVTNPNLINIKIASQTFIPDANHNINLNIVNYGQTEIIISFKSLILTYKVLIYNQTSLPTFTNTANFNKHYVGTVNNALYDINSSNTTDGFKITFDYSSTIQYVNVITFQSDNMIPSMVVTIKPNTSFTFINNTTVYGLQTVDWANNSSWQYFVFYQNINDLPIPNFWNTKDGNSLWKAALDRGYLAGDLENMTAQQIRNLIFSAQTWALAKTSGNILGLIISAFTIMSIISVAIATSYNWYLKKQLNS